MSRRIGLTFRADASAYTSVPARKTFARQPPLEPVQSSPVQNTVVASTAPLKTEKPKRDWPLPVRQYVQRSFAAENKIAGIEREEMETKLKQIISEAAESNNLMNIDWESLQLPQQMLRNERANALLSPAKAPWSDTFSTLTVKETNGTSNGTTSKKRKSSDLASAPFEHEPPPPWRTTNTTNVFEDRISYADKRQRNDLTGKGSSKSHSNLEKRKRRFEDGHPRFQSPQPFASPKEASPTRDIDQGPVVGRSQELEKKYFRLTSAPNPDTIRPLAVLEKTLEHLKKRWKKENNYSYICDQFKSLRQDLTVQHIKSEFTVNVYEIHARIALEKGDLGEYNQCQTQLRALYAQKLGGHPTEFKAYRILYFIHTCNRTDMNDVLADLTPAEKKEPAVKHALDARSALALGNFHRFFQLYLETPNMGAYLMDMFVGRERLAALSNICRAYVHHTPSFANGH